LGFLGKTENGSDIGYFGLEGYYDIALSGKPGYSLRQKDVRGAPITAGGVSDVSSLKGANLITHLNKRIQLLLEEKLKEGIDKYGAKQALGIIMEPSSGAVLAMASHPSYDPSKYYEYEDLLFKNPAISDSFEPGSIFKVLVMAAGLDSEVIKPDTKCDICDRPFKIDKYFIKTWNNEYHKDSTMTEVLVNSDNVGMSFIAGKIGKEKLYDYLDKFGIGKNTGIDLQGEISPKMRKRGSWNEVDLATASFGQGIAVTPIQMVTAVSAIANGGVLMQPQVVDRVEIGSWDDEIPVVEKGRVIEEKTASEMIAMMEEAASKGESKWIGLKGFRVAGKTGTAQIPIAGHYDEEKTIASFVGFAPSEDPKFVMLISLMEPESSQWASETAAPLWYSVAKELFTYFGIQPKN